MADGLVSRFVSTLRRRRAAAGGMTALLRERAGFEDVKVIEVLKIGDASDVYLVRLGGDRAVVKHFRGDGAGDRVLGQKAELDILADAFGDGPNQAMRSLHALPELGVAVLSEAPGRRLHDLVPRAAPARRAHLLTRSGEWLAAYTAIRSREASFGPGFWVERATKRPRVHADAAEIELLERLQRALRARSKAHSGLPVRQAATHGDYVPINMLVDGETFTGVDIQGESWLAVARDAARFLVWCALHDDKPALPLRYGLPEADIVAFLNSGVLAPHEVDTTLAFFIGEQLHARLCESTLPRRSRAAEAIEAYLAEPLP